MSVDDDLVDELEETPLEDPFITEYGTDHTGEDGEDPIAFAGDWFPGADEWQAKTAITPHQAHALAVVRQLPDLYDELEELEPFLDNLVQDYEMYLTSVGGASREQHVSILRSIFGGDAEEMEETRNMLLGAFAGSALDKES